MSNLYIIKQRFIEHITLVQQVAVSNILEQIAESAVIIKNSLKNGKKVAATAAAPQTASIWLLNL